MSNFYKNLVERINSYKRIPASVTELYLNVKKYLPKNPNILEAGAHMGYDTYGLARIWSAGRVYAFEPVPDLYAELRERTRNLKNVKTFKLALGNENRNLEMYVSGGGSTASSSILKPRDHLEVFPAVTFDNKISVQVKKVSDWAKSENISVIDLFWLDMQGFEVYALQGAGDLLRNVKVIYTELCRNELYSGMFTKESYIEFLDKSGFDLISLTGDGEISDGIFVNKIILNKGNNRDNINS
ncbi:MAG TPA: FkbM family methyltransferase [Chryseolinea sp.]|nr:FkbM family methyltransferase [Chryseolinea sp.]